MTRGCPRPKCAGAIVMAAGIVAGTIAVIGDGIADGITAIGAGITDAGTAIAGELALNRKQARSGPIPTFASRCSEHFCECWNQGPLENIDSSGALDLTFACECAAG